MAEFLHPSVSSKIVDQSQIFVTSAGVTTLFQVITSDQGPDNAVTDVTSPSELAFMFGSPNMKKHGQAMYNLTNWVTAGGGGKVLRVLPPNAHSSHAFLNIQTKVSGTGAASVSVRPTVTGTSVRSTSLGDLKSELAAAHPDTVDGYTNHFLMSFFPRIQGKMARGVFYDDFAVEFSLRRDLDETYAFRTWDFTVLKKDSSGNYVTVDGPFLVSLAPEAISNSHESMHVEYVVNTYSQYVGCLFNEDAYDQLGHLINKDVDPGLLDLLTLQEQKLAAPVVLHGEAVLALVNDDITRAIVDIDNKKRAVDYANALASVTALEGALDALESKVGGVGVPYAALVNTQAGIINGHLGTLPGASSPAGTLEKLMDDLLNSLGDVAQSAAANLVINFCTGAGSGWADAVRAAIDAASILGVTPGILAAKVGLQGVELDVKVIATTQVKKLAEDSSLNAAKAAVQLADLDVDLGAKLTACATALVAVDTAIALAQVMFPTGTPALTTAIADQAAAHLALAAALIATPNTYAAKVAATVTLTETACDDAKLAVRSCLTGDEVATAQALYVAMKQAILDTDAALAVAASTPVTLAALPGLLTVGHNLIVEAKDVATNVKVLTYDVILQDPSLPLPFGNGSDGDLDIKSPLRAATIQSLQVQGFMGTIPGAEDLTNKKVHEIDMLLDANYPDPVKAAMHTLAFEIRKDFPCYLDTGFTATPQAALDHRRGTLSMSTFYTAIFTQDLTVFDSFTGQDIKVTPTYYLASMIPVNDSTLGIQWTFVGPRRGIISGNKSLSFNPTEPWKERLYLEQVNYIEHSIRRTNFGSQLTSQKTVSALSDCNNVRVLLKIIRDIEAISETYSFEFGDSKTYSSLEAEINGYLTQWTANRACTVATGTVFASAYDKKRKQARVRVELSFNSVIERILQEFVVN
jgi:hypothetical protein